MVSSQLYYAFPHSL